MDFKEIDSSFKVLLAMGTIMQPFMVESRVVESTNFAKPESKSNSDDETISEGILPVLIQIRTLRNYLQKFTIPQIYGIHRSLRKDPDKYWTKGKKLKSMERKLRNCNTDIKLLAKINYYLKKYDYNLKQLLSYQLQTSIINYTTKMASRRNIWSNLKDFLDLTKLELEELLESFNVNKNRSKAESIQPIYQKKLIEIPPYGDLTEMELIDTYFSDHLSGFLEIVIKLLEYKWSIENILKSSSDDFME